MPHALLLPSFLIAREQAQRQGGGDETGREVYLRAVRDAIRGGGCNTSRAGTIGAVLAATGCGSSAEAADWLPVPLECVVCPCFCTLAETL